MAFNDTLGQQPQQDPFAEIQTSIEQVPPEDRAAAYAVFTGRFPTPPELAETKATLDAMPPPARKRMLDAIKPPIPDQAGAAAPGGQGQVAAPSPAAPRQPGGVGNMVDYQDDPDSGLTMVTLRNGEKIALMEEEAANAKRMIDASRGLEGPRLAKNDEEANLDNIQAAGNKAFSGEGGGGIVHPDVEFSAGKSATDAQTGVGASAAAGAQTQPAGETRFGFGAERGNELVQDEAGRVYIERRTGGRAARTSADIERDAAGARPVPVKQTTSITGEYPEDPEFMEGMDEVLLQRRLQLQNKGDQLQQFAQEEIKTADKEEKAANARLRRQEERRAALEKKVAEREAIKDRKKAEYAAQGVDPNRIFRGEGGTLRAIGAAIAAGMGAFAATVGRTPNYALEVINKAIDDDIAAQRRQIEIKGDDADNALADYMRAGLEMNEAEAALRERQNEATRSQLALQRAKRLPQQIQQNMDELDLALQENGMKMHEQSRRDSIGVATRQVDEQFQYEQSGSAGGVSRELASVDDVLKAQKALAGVKGGGSDAPLSSEHMKAVEQSTKAINQGAEVLQLLDKYPKERLDDTWDDPTAGWEAKSPLGRELDRKTEAFVATEQAAAEVGSTEDDYQRIRKSIVGKRGTVGDRLNGARDAVKNNARRIVQRMAAFPDQAPAIYRSLSPAARAAVDEVMDQ